jgi:hypothetical protein
VLLWESERGDKKNGVAVALVWSGKGRGKTKRPKNRTLDAAGAKVLAIG